MGNPSYEGVDYNDPLSILLAAESDDDSELDERTSRFMAGRHRAKCYESERTSGDLLGASPNEIKEATEH